MIPKLLASKKLLVLLSTTIVLVGNKIVGHFGYELDPTTVQYYVGLSIAYILGQGIADHGKGAAEVNAAVLEKAAASAKAPLGSAFDTKQAGFARLGVLLVIAALGLATGGIAACSWFSKEAKSPTGKAVVSCVESSAAKAATKEFGALVDQALLYAMTGDGKINTDSLKPAAATMALDSGMCVLADRFAAAMQPKPTDPNAPKSSPVEADPASLRAAFDELRARYAPGQVFHTEHGVL